MVERMRSGMMWMALAGFALLAAPYAQARAPSQIVTMTVHDQRVMRLSGTPTRVAVGNPKVADIKILSFGSGAAGPVLLLAHTPGTTDVQAWVGRPSMPVRRRASVVSGVRNVLESTGGPLSDARIAAACPADVNGQKSRS